MPSRGPGIIGAIGPFLLRHPRLVRFLRYAIGSGCASATSAATLWLLYHEAGASTTVSSTAAFCAGAVVNFVIYRFWAWRATVRKEVGALGRDLAGFAIVAVTTALFAVATTGLTDRAARHAGISADTRGLLVEGAYFGAFAVTFAFKFIALDRWVFAGTARRSRTQVDTTTRA